MTSARENLLILPPGSRPGFRVERPKGLSWFSRIGEKPNDKPILADATATSLPMLRPVGLPELQSRPDVSPPVGHGLERGRVSGRGRPLGNGPILGESRDLRGFTRQTDCAQDRILVPGRGDLGAKLPTGGG